MDQITIKLPKEMKTKLKVRSAYEGKSMTDILVGLIADHLEMERPPVSEKATAILPRKEAIPDWYFEVRGQPISKLDDWLRQHLFTDTSIPEIWKRCFKLEGKPKQRETMAIGNYMRRAGWARTRNVVSSYRVNHEYGKSRVYVLSSKAVPDEELLV